VDDPPTDLSELDLSVSDNADFLVADPTGRRTGFDASSGQILQEIPGSSYSADAVTDGETGATTTLTTRSIQIRQPVRGNYHVVLSGCQNSLEMSPS
jgi:hypothetical protein